MKLSGLRSIQLALAGFVALSTIAASVPYQNDAGTGSDASDFQSAPSPIPDYGAYAGGSRSNSDADWFSVTNATTARVPTCTILDASGDTYESVTLGVSASGGTHTVSATLPANGTVRLALAAMLPSSAQIGLVPVPNPSGSTPARPGSYQFSVQGYTSADLGAGDGGLGSAIDAGSWPNAIPLSNACTRGSLMPMSGLGDTSDAYSFTLTQSSQIVYSLAAPAGVTLSVLDAAGATVPGSAITSGGALGNLTLPAGTFYMNAAAPSGTGTLDYIIGMIGGPPGPCRPTCSTS